MIDVAVRMADRRVPRAPHGTWARYCAKCRCDMCVAAGSEYSRLSREARKQQVKFVPPEHLMRKAEPLVLAEPIPAGTPGTVTRNFSYRASVAPSVASRLNRVFGHTRYVYNAYIALARRSYAAGQKHPSGYDGCKQVVTQGRANPDTVWLTEVPSQVLRESVMDAAQAYENFFCSITGKRKGPRMGRPKMRKKTSRQRATFGAKSFSINGGAESTRGSGGRLWLSKVGYVSVNWHRPLPAAPSSVTAIRTPEGSYRVVFTVTMPAPKQKIPARNDRHAGVDLGLTDFAAIVYTDGTREKVPAQQYLRKAEKKIARLSRELSRRKRGSNNYRKTRMKLARAHERVRNLRMNQARQLASQLIRENQSIAVEDLNIAGLARTRMGKSVRDVGWGMFLNQLTVLAAQHGRVVGRVDRFFPSSQMCCMCRKRTGKKPLNVREFTCPHCKVRLDRDYNAAVNIMVEAGLAETVNACGADVRLRLARAVGDEAGTHLNPRPGAGRRKVRAGAQGLEAILRSGRHSRRV